MEADLQRFYGLHLWAELEGPVLRWARLARLVRQLPEEAATWRSMFGEDAVWTMDRHLAALTIDQLAVANWQRSGGKRKDYPKPIPRPGVRRGTRVGDASKLTPAAARALLDARRPTPSEEVTPDGHGTGSRLHQPGPELRRGDRQDRA